MGLVKFIFSKLFLKNLGIAIVLAIIIIGGLKFYLSSYTNHNEHVLVPNLNGKTVEESAQLLEDLNLSYLVIDSIWSNDNLGGTIMAQIPDAQSEVKEGREIYLTTYRHEPDSKILDIKEGDDQYVAKIKLGNMRVEYEVIYEANELLTGRVLRITQNGEKIKFGDNIKPGSKVNLYVGERRDQDIKVPDVSGLTLEEAEFLLLRSNLSLGYPFYDEVVKTAEDTLNAKVYMQSPIATEEEVIKEGSSVDLWLSSVDLLNLDQDGKKDQKDKKRN